MAASGYNEWNKGKVNDSSKHKIALMGFVYDPLSTRLIVLHIFKEEVSRDGLGQAVNYYHKAVHLGCCSSPRYASECL